MSSGQGAVCKATLKYLKDVNGVLAQAKEHSKAGLYYEAGAINWETAVVVTVSDASFAQETEHEPDGNMKPHRTQKAFINLLVDNSVSGGGLQVIGKQNHL